MPAFIYTIKGRLYLVFTVIFALILALATALTVEKTSLEETLSEATRTGIMLEAFGDITTTINGMDASIRAHAQNGEQEALHHYHNQLDRLNHELASVRQQTLATNQAQLDALDRLEEQINSHQERFYSPLLDTESSQTLAPEAFASLIALVDKAEELESEIVAAFEHRVQRANDQLQQLQWITLSAVAFLLFIIVILALPVVRGISKRLHEVTSVAEQVGGGNLSEAVEVGGKDEISRVLKSFARMRNQLRKLVQGLQNQSTQLATSSNQVAESADSISQATEEQSQASDQISAAIEQLTVSISHVSESARQAYDYSEEAKTASESGTQVITSTVDSMNGIAEESGVTAEKLHQLSDNSQKISSIVDQIQAIAEQTNLLALNAAIESARAGEHGRGFAVVADEVRQLAQRSSEATDEISSMVEMTQKGIEEAVTSMQRTVEVIGKGSAEASEAGQAIEEIRRGALATADIINQTSTALEEQTAVSQDVACQVESIASMTVETAAAASQASSAARSLQSIAEELRGSVAVFKT